MRTLPPRSMSLACKEKVREAAEFGVTTSALLLQFR
jgi:hypothetical protein